MPKHIDIVAMGEAMVEFNQTRPAELSYLQGHGGDTSNAVIAASRLGAKTAYVSAVGDDVFGRKLGALWKHEGVDTSGVRIDNAAPTGVYFVHHGENGHEFSYLRAGSAASRMQVKDLPLDLITSAKVLLASGISLGISVDAADCVLEAFQKARDAGVTVVLDSNLRLKLWPLARARAVISEAVSLCDHFLPSLDDLQILTGLQEADAIIDWSHERGAKAVMLKMGSQGVRVSDGARRETVAGFRVASVDATGAGDCFGGAFLARFAAGDSIWEAARYANAAAALSTTGFGAVAPLPKPKQVEALLALNSRPG